MDAMGAMDAMAVMDIHFNSPTYLTDIISHAHNST